MKKYVTFNFGGCDPTYVVKRDSIVGFSAEPFMVVTHILLDSGARISMNKVFLKDAEKILEEFDRENNVS